MGAELHEVQSLGVHHTIVGRRPVVSGKGERYGHDQAVVGVVESVFRFASG